MENLMLRVQGDSPGKDLDAGRHHIFCDVLAEDYGRRGIYVPFQ